MTRNTGLRALPSLLVTLLLVLVLGGLGYVYWSMMRPAQVAEESDRDRAYLFSIYGFEGDLLRRPSSVAVGPGGDIYVADTGKKRIVVFDEDGDFVTQYGTVGEGPTDLWEPLGVAVAPDGRSYVVEKSKKKLVLFDAQKAPITAITLEEYPLSVRVADDTLFVTTESGVLIADLDGNLLTGYIKRGKEPGAFDRPGGVAVGEDGTLYIADSLNYRVQAIGTDGQPIWQYGEPIPEGATMNMTQDTGQVFGLPASIDIDENGYLYVVDGLNSELVVLDSQTGERIEVVGDVGHDDGKFYYPDGIAYGDGRLVVADKYNDRVQVFRVPQAASVFTASSWLPYAPLLLLLPLLALFLRRKPRYVMAPAFLARLAADRENADMVARSLGVVLVSTNLSSAVAERSDIPKALELKAADTPSDAVDAVVERYGVDRGESEALVRALNVRGKKVVLVDSASTAATARELGLSAISYDEILASLRSKEPTTTSEESVGLDE